jgi:ABC-type transporter Mla MlaB component
VDLHIYFHNVPDLGLFARLDQIDSKLASLIQQGTQTMADLTALTAEVSRNTEVDQSAIALLTGLAAQIEALKTDPIALQTLADQLKGSSDALAAAVVANTPAQP